MRLHRTKYVCTGMCTVSDESFCSSCSSSAKTSPEAEGVLCACDPDKLLPQVSSMRSSTYGKVLWKITQQGE
jgi:hypothetical protein